MSLLRLIIREISHRKLNFLLSVVGVSLAAAAILGVISLLRVHDAETDRVIGKMMEGTKARMAQLNDDIRKAMKKPGFNIYIFPKDQDMSEVYSEGFASKVMPESYVTTLAESKIVTVNHLLPSLTRKMRWPEEKRTVVLIGIRGEVPIAHRDPKKPLIYPVEPGHMVLGYELHNSLGIKEGDSITFMEREFKVSKAHTARGTADDISIWMNLAECQEMLELEGKINAIQALECNCETIDRLGEIRQELLAILPDTQIIETSGIALARAEARVKTKLISKAEIEEEEKNRQEQRKQRKQFAATMGPAVSVISMAWIALLAFGNVRERVTEIGLLRAVGAGSKLILGAFLGKALLVGLLGATLAVGLFWFTTILFPGSFGSLPFFELVGSTELIILAVSAPILAAIASWLPALKAALRDPAAVLRHD